MSKHYVLKRYYPYVEDDDNEEIVYITKDYKDAVKTAAYIHKADVESWEENEYYDPDDDYYYSTIEIETITNEQGYKNYEAPKEDEVYYLKAIRSWIQTDLNGRYNNSIGNPRYSYYLKADENLEYVGIPDKLIPQVRPGLRIAKIYRNSINSGMAMTINFIIINNDVNKLDDYDEYIKQLIEEATDLLNSGEDIVDIEQYIEEVFDNTVKE